MSYARFVLGAMGVLMVPQQAFAQEQTDDAVLAQEESDGGGWSVTITPRYQHLLFNPSLETEELDTLPSYGASVALRSPDGRFGVMGTFMTGEGDGEYTIEDENFADRYSFNASREEIQLTGEFTPRNTNVSLLAGYHRFNAASNEVLLNAAPNSEVGSYDISIDAFEFGARLSSALGEGSRHSLSAQFVFGIGSGSFASSITEVFAGTTTTSVIDDEGTGYLADIALGYNFFITDSLAIGARGRGYIFYVDVDDANPVFAIAPEVNLSIRF